MQEALLVIVLYKTRLSDSLTFQSLTGAVRSYKPIEPVDLLICDNSPTGYSTIDQANEEGMFRLYYLHDPLNPGVSRSYNRAAELATVQNKRWLFLFDQDTILPEDGLIRYERAVTTYPNFPLYAPQVWSGTLLFSPCRYWFRRGSNLRSIEPGVQAMAHRNVLNSGLFIELSAFVKCGGYDEVVQLYFSDFVFFDRLKRHFCQFVVVDCKLEHQLSSADFSEVTLASTRFSYYCRGARQASHGNGWAYVEYAITVGLRSLVMSSRFRSTQFVKIFINDFLLYH
jgi:GT2 family glycosyltransferase